MTSVSLLRITTCSACRPLTLCKTCSYILISVSYFQSFFKFYCITTCKLIHQDGSSLVRGTAKLGKKSKISCIRPSHEEKLQQSNFLLWMVYKVFEWRVWKMSVDIKDLLVFSRCAVLPFHCFHDWFTFVPVVY